VMPGESPPRGDGNAEAHEPTGDHIGGKVDTEEDPVQPDGQSGMADRTLLIMVAGRLSKHCPQLQPLGHSGFGGFVLGSPSGRVTLAAMRSSSGASTPALSRVSRTTVARSALCSAMVAASGSASSWSRAWSQVGSTHPNGGEVLHVVAGAAAQIRPEPPGQLGEVQRI
jgi:hypothetical protein